jgi:hypothetical protein
MNKGERVIDELRERAERGHPLNSGANRGDWLYAAAMLAFGSWRNAVVAAGFSYDDIKIRPYTKAETIAMLKPLVATGAPILSKEQEGRLVAAAHRHFGGWDEAMKAAGGDARARKWTRQRVLDRIREDRARGLKLNAVAVHRRDTNLYQAGRRRFGTWAAALEAATGEADPIVDRLREERRAGRPLAERSVRRRNPELFADAVERFGGWPPALDAAFGTQKARGWQRPSRKT